MARRKGRLAAHLEFAELRHRARGHRKHQPRGRLAVIDDDVLRPDVRGREPLLAKRHLQRYAGGDHLFRDHRVARLDRERLPQRSRLTACLGKPWKIDCLEPIARPRHRAQRHRD